VKLPSYQTKKTKQLPNRAALNALERGQRTIMDYSKLSPIKEDEPTSVIVQNLRDR
jgi:hypothetical protein